MKRLESAQRSPLTINPAFDTLMFILSVYLTLPYVGLDLEPIK